MTYVSPARKALICIHARRIARFFTEANRARAGYPARCGTTILLDELETS